MRNLLLSSLLAGLLLAPAAGNAADPDAPLGVDPQVVTGRLENGLTYTIRENHKPENRVELRLVVKAGSIEEEDDQQGLAHFLEHMAFNGTEHFESNELISYLESIGARFGADINAYTSFDETVYMLEIPTDREGLVEKGMLVLSDWARGITLDPEEVEKERGVVLEEWRLGQGAQERLRRVHWPVLLEGSRYAERLPIGKPEVIETAPPSRLRDFYDKWYRPDLMRVVAVGAVDAGELEGLIREYFDKIPAVQNPAPLPHYTVPPHSDIRYSVAADPEMPYTQLSINFKRDERPEGTVEAYRQNLVEGLVSSMMNSRLAEISQEPDAPFRFAAVGEGSPFRSLRMYRGFAVTQDEKLDDALRALWTEIRRAQVHGFEASEVDRAKQEFLAGMERAYNERDKTESATYASEYIRNFLDNEPIPGIEAEYALSQELMDGITLADIGTSTEEMFRTENVVIQASQPEKEGLEPASPDTLKEITGEMLALSPPAYVDETASGELVSNLPPPGKVVSRRTEEALGLTILTLSNGIEVAMKPTDFKDDQIVFETRVPGGTSRADDQDFPSASVALSLVGIAGLGDFTPTELDKKLSGKLVGVSPYADTFLQGFRGSSTPKDLETMFQLLYLYFTAPNQRPEAFDVLMDRMRLFITNREASPEARYSDVVTEVNLCDHPRFQPPSLAKLDEIDRDTAMKFYRELMSRPSDYHFYFVGALDPKVLEDLAVRYLGALPGPAEGPAPGYRDIGLEFPKGITRKTVYAGTEPKSQTRITWPALTGLDEMEMFYLRKANDILEVRLRDVLREELGGTYSVGVGYTAWMPYPDYGTTSVGFGSAPDRAEALTETVLSEVAKFKAEGPTEEEVAKIREQEHRALETGLEQNGYWLGSLATLDMLGWDLNRILERGKRVDSLTPEVLHEVLGRYYPDDNYTVITLEPEGSEDGGEGSR